MFDAVLGAVWWVVFAAFAVPTVLLSFFIVRQQTSAVVERFGKYARVSQAGERLICTRDER